MLLIFIRTYKKIVTPFFSKVTGQLFERKLLSVNNEFKTIFDSLLSDSNYVSKFSMMKVIGLDEP